MNRKGLYWRVRFLSANSDPRPVTFPPPGPYWISGYQYDFLSDDSMKTVLIAYLPKKSDLKKYWPEAEVDGWYGQMPIKFTDRFPKPDWWQP